MCSAEIVLAEFQELNETFGGVLTDKQVKKFVEDNFSPPGSELLQWDPPDWKEK